MSPQNQTTPYIPDWTEVRSALAQAARERILILDGAMGTMIQRLKLSEENFRGERFRDWKLPLQGNNDLLVLTEPQRIEDIHFDYFMAGADIAETNTFSATSVAQADYACESAVYDINFQGVLVDRRAAQRAEAADGRRRFVAGALGPTNKTSSMSTDVNSPGHRASTCSRSAASTCRS